MAVAFATLFILTTWPRRRPREDGEGGSLEPAAELRVAGLGYLAAATAFALVSPLDLTVAVPVVLVAAITCGAPAAERRLTWQLPGQVWTARAKALTVLATVIVAGALVVAVVGGVQWYRADRAFAGAARVGSAVGMAQAASLWSWEPFYALEAGGKTWRDGLANQDPAAVDRGRALVESGIERDPTGALGYADLARLDIAQGQLRQAAKELGTGLRRNPHHPALQGLWGYSALVAQTAKKNDALANELMRGLRSLPADTPDAWYWISQVMAAQGDTAGATEARARARELAPSLGSWRYRQRLLSGR